MVYRMGIWHNIYVLQYTLDDTTLFQFYGTTLFQFAPFMRIPSSDYTGWSKLFCRTLYPRTGDSDYFRCVSYIVGLAYPGICLQGFSEFWWLILKFCVEDQDFFCIFLSTEKIIGATLYYFSSTRAFGVASCPWMHLVLSRLFCDHNPPRLPLLFIQRWPSQVIQGLTG
jgi:hypothetical protein